MKNEEINGGEIVKVENKSISSSNPNEIEIRIKEQKYLKLLEILQQIFSNHQNLPMK